MATEPRSPLLNFCTLLVLVVLAVVIVNAAFGEARAPYGDKKSVEAGRTHEGEFLDCDLLEKDHIANIGSKIDGLGMCVDSSLEMAARFAGLDQYRGFRDWAAAKEGGGSYPGKVDKQLAAFCKEKNLPAPQYVQYEGPDPGPIIEAALKSGRMACITYGWSPRYPREPYIAHMVCLPKFSGKYAAVLDNNFVGTNRYEWMDKDELIRRVKFPRGPGWVFVWLAPPPPASPRNL